ncbi:hypothetical protein ONE63_006525 [Megalurothrips usitatus]|uniref:Methylated-DNA--protein-cysteine methyltransferase n=1 Tax=Megalurothrips usitatus TaxID=439358 RepID=A0AAV7Y117_9NEOP|nr:hypothetical protein ONE63_006525 [Megalurothrips usitatus]
MEKKKTKQTTLACGDGMKRSIETVRISTPIGEMMLRVCPVGLHMIYQNGEIMDENFIPEPRKRVTLLSEYPRDEKAKLCVSDCMRWLSSYFHDLQNVSQHTIPQLCPLMPGSTKFRDRVLMSLVKSVPAGKTITYGELASLSGSSGAQQAVGSTMAANPFQLIVPCHRVIKSGKKVGKYSGGCRNLVKIWLLQHEGFNIDENGTVSSGH